MRTIKDFRGFCDCVNELFKERYKDLESLKKAAVAKATAFATDVAGLFPKAIEEIAAMLDDIIPDELADWIVAYCNFLQAEEATEGAKDFCCDEDEKRFRYKLPCAPKHVLRRGVKLWKTNRAIYRPYAAA